MTMLLTVCNANVCRSPLAQELLRNQFADSTGQGLDVRSAGIQAVEGQPICLDAAAALGWEMDALAPQEGHVSHRLCRDDIIDADLILVATLEQRSVVAQLCPDARHRSFTVLEALAFLRELARQAEQDQPKLSESSDLESISARMNELRSTVTARSEPELRGWIRSRLRRVGQVNELDVRDGHLGSKRQHRETIHLIQDGVLEIATVLKALGVGRTAIGGNHSLGHP